MPRVVIAEVGRDWRRLIGDRELMISNGKGSDADRFIGALCGTARNIVTSRPSRALNATISPPAGARVNSVISWRGSLSGLRQACYPRVTICSGWNSPPRPFVQ